MHRSDPAETGCRARLNPSSSSHARREPLGGAQPPWLGSWRHRAPRLDGPRVRARHASSGRGSRGARAAACGQARWVGNPAIRPEACSASRWIVPPMLEELPRHFGLRAAPAPPRDRRSARPRASSSKVTNFAGEVGRHARFTSRCQARKAGGVTGLITTGPFGWGPPGRRRREGPLGADLHHAAADVTADAAAGQSRPGSRGGPRGRLGERRDEEAELARGQRGGGEGQVVVRGRSAAEQRERPGEARGVGDARRAYCVPMSSQASSVPSPSWSREAGDPVASQAVPAQ